MTWDEIAKRMNTLTSEEIAVIMETLPTDALEVAVRFEALAETEPS